MEKTTKACPGCKRPIEKNKGCDHMECTYIFPVAREEVGVSECDVKADRYDRCEMPCSLLLEVFEAVLCVQHTCAEHGKPLCLSWRT